MNKLDALWKAAPREDTPPVVTAGPITPTRDATPYAARALADEAHAVRTTTEGGRNDRLNVAAVKLGSLVSGGHLNEHDVTDTLTAAAKAAGLTETETRATIRSGLGKGKQTPRIIPEYAGADPQVVEVESLTDDEEDTFWDANPLLRHLHTFARARRVSPWAVLGVTLCRISCAVPPHVVLPPIVGGHASLNLYVALVGRSGSGKGASESVSADALRVRDVESFTPGSGEGIAHTYKRRIKGEVEDIRRAALFTLPEIDALGGLGGRQGSTLLPELRKAWSGERLGFAYANPEKNLPMDAHSYRLCLVAGVQPGRGHVLLDDEAAGTPQRFCWLPATDPQAPDRAPACPEPLEWKPPTWGKLRADGSGRAVLDVCEEARKEIETAHLARTRGEAEALDGHALLCRLKAAAALALMLGHGGVDEPCWRLSGLLMRVSDATRDSVVQHLKSEAKQRNTARGLAEAERQQVVAEKVSADAVRKACASISRQLERSDEWVTKRELRRGMSPKSAREHIDDAIDKMRDTGQLEVAEEGQTTWVRKVTDE